MPAQLVSMQTDGDFYKGDLMLVPVEKARARRGVAGAAVKRKRGEREEEGDTSTATGDGDEQTQDREPAAKMRRTEADEGAQGVSDEASKSTEPAEACTSVAAGFSIVHQRRVVIPKIVDVAHIPTDPSRRPGLCDWRNLFEADTRQSLLYILH